MPRPQRPWFRFYVEAIHDRKLRRLPPAQRWLWIVVLAMARQSPVPGYLLLTCDGNGLEAVDENDLADAAAIKVSEVRAGMAAFRKMGMLTLDETLKCDAVTKWGERQFESDEVAARTRKHRSKPPDETTLERSYDVPGNNGSSKVGTPPENIGIPEVPDTYFHHQVTHDAAIGDPAERVWDDLR